MLRILLDGVQVGAAQGKTPEGEDIVSLRLICPETKIMVDFNLVGSAIEEVRNMLNVKHTPVIEIAQIVPK